MTQTAPYLIKSCLTLLDKENSLFFVMEANLDRERLLSPKQLGAIVGLSVTQIRALMNDGKLEYIEISSKTKMLTLSGWERFQRSATVSKTTEIKN